MPKVIAAQTNFSAGQLSPRLHGQPDLKGYQSGVAEMYNFYPLAHGPFRRRNGWHYVTDIPGTFGVLKPMQVSTYESYMLAISNDGYLYLNNEGGPVHGDDLLTNGDFNDGWTAWTDTSNSPGVAVIADGLLTLQPGSHPSNDYHASVLQTVSIINPTENHHLHWISPDTEVGNRFRIMIGTTPGGYDIVDEDHTDAIGYTNFTPGAGNTTIYLTMYAYTNDPDRIFNLLFMHDTTSDTHLKFAHPWTTDQQIREIQIAQPPGGHQVYFVQRDQPPQVLTLVDPDVWSFGAISFSNAPAEWVSGNYPGTIAFFQGRLWLGGTYEEPEDLWASKSGVYTDFDQGTGLADEAMWIPMDRAGEIVWLVGGKDMVVGTTNSENIIVSDSAIVKPGDIAVKQQSYYGSKRTQPIQVGNKIIFITADSMKLRDMGFEWTKDSYTSRDLLWIAEDLGKGPFLLSGSWLQTPESLLIIQRSDSTILIGQYDDDLNTFGWSVNQGYAENVFDIKAILQDGLPTLFCLVTMDEGDSVLRLLYDPPGLGNVFMDYAKILTPEDPETQVKQITGVTHLANKTVSIVVDGAVHPDRTLDGSGDDSEELQFYGNEYVYVGINYESTLTTLVPVTGLPEGMDRTNIKQFGRIFLDLQDSSIPKIKGDRPPLRHPATPMDTREPFHTGLIHVGDLGHDRDAAITIVQDLPLKTFVRGIYLEKKTTST